MLSKKANDIIFIGVIVLLMTGIVIGRFMALGTMDERIETIETENQALEAEIMGRISLVNEYRDENLPSASTLSRYVPSHYSRAILLNFVHAQLELEGIHETAARNLVVNVHDDVSFPSASRFSGLSSTFHTSRVEVRFNTTDLDEIAPFVERLYGTDQIFLLQSVRYEVSETEGVAIRVVMNFITFYNT